MNPRYDLFGRKRPGVVKNSINVLSCRSEVEKRLVPKIFPPEVSRYSRSRSLNDLYEEKGVDPHPGSLDTKLFRRFTKTTYEFKLLGRDPILRHKEVERVELSR